MTVRYGSYLTRPQVWALDEACKPLVAVFGPPMLVGSVMERADFRDVDLRLILMDEVYDCLEDPQWALISFLTSAHLAATTGLPVDFQFQRMTEANAAYAGKPRNPMGVRQLGRDWVGDGRPERVIPPG